MSERIKKAADSFLHFIKSALFLNNLLAVVGSVLFLLLFVIWWLRCYTHHGQKLVVENYIGTLVADADKDAQSKDLRMVMEDSVFVVGKPGGMILAQNPPPGSTVKENRRIYITVTKFQADMIPLSSLPGLYGQEVNGVQKTLKQRFAIESKVIQEVFDEGPPNMILAVLYNGDTIINAKRKVEKVMIPKGGTLDLIISKDYSESVSLPNMECQTFNQADFLLRANRLTLGTVHLDANVTNRFSAFVYRQDPPWSPDVILDKGDTISIWLTQAKPARCPEVAEEMEE